MKNKEFASPWTTAPAQDAPKTPQDAPRGAQEAPKTHQNPSKFHTYVGNLENQKNIEKQMKINDF